MDDYLGTVGAAWDAGPAAGKWIGPHLDEFGQTLGHAVPAGYGAYAVVPIPWGEAFPERQEYAVLEALLDVLKAHTAQQAVHTGLWEGWGWLYDGGDPHVTSGFGVARPDAEPLGLPHRNYFLWSGPLASAMALRHRGDPPSLIWPDDRSWFIGAPIYTNEYALGATEQTVQAVLDAPAMRELGARRASRDDVLDIDD